MSCANREQNRGVPSVPPRGGTGSITRGEVPGQQNLHAPWVEGSRAQVPSLPAAGANVSLCPLSAPPGQRLRREREDAARAGREAGGHRIVAMAGKPAVQDGAHLRG